MELKTVYVIYHIDIFDGSFLRLSRQDRGQFESMSHKSGYDTHQEALDALSNMRGRGFIILAEVWKTWD